MHQHLKEKALGSIHTAARQKAVDDAGLQIYDGQCTPEHAGNVQAMLCNGMSSELHSCTANSVL